MFTFICPLELCFASLPLSRFRDHLTSKHNLPEEEIRLFTRQAKRLRLRWRASFPFLRLEVKIFVVKMQRLAFDSVGVMAALADDGPLFNFLLERRAPMLPFLLSFCSRPPKSKPLHASVLFVLCFLLVNWSVARLIWCALPTFRSASPLRFWFRCASRFCCA